MDGRWDKERLFGILGFEWRVWVRALFMRSGSLLSGLWDNDVFSYFFTVAFSWLIQ